jgi:hypothetical protein
MANRRVKVTIEGTYELVPECYPGCKTPEEMVKVDENNENLDVQGLLESLDDKNDTITVTFQVVEE